MNTKIFTVNTIEISPAGTFIHTKLHGVFTEYMDAVDCFNDVVDYHRSEGTGKEICTNHENARRIFQAPSKRKTIVEVLGVEGQNKA